MPRATPARDAPPATAEAILDAAEELIAAKGFERTTIKDIGRDADANPALIYYYFGDKAGLYRAVLDRIGNAVRDRAVPAVREARSPEALVRGIIAAQAGMLSRHPKAAAILVREMVDSGGLHGSEMIRRLAAELFQPAFEAVEAAQRAGTIRRDLDPRFCVLSTISQVIYFVIARPAVRAFLDKPAGFPSRADAEAFAEHAIAFATAALSPPSPGRAA
ncbi:MAG: TetR/AcrR family transcriptional regulator [Gemmatimonadales bacterium]